MSTMRVALIVGAQTPDDTVAECSDIAISGVEPVSFK